MPREPWKQTRPDARLATQQAGGELLCEVGRRCLVATHPAASKKSRIGQTRKDVVYELFFTQLPQDGFTASDVIALYLHRGAFETVLSDEDVEQDPDRWCCHSAWGQECWQVVSQW